MPFLSFCGSTCGNSLAISADGRASLLTVAPPRVASSEDRTFTDITAFARAEFGGMPQKPIDYDLIPTAVFSTPEVATVGLTEEEARAELGEVDIYQSKFLPLKLTMSERKERTLMKLVVERPTGRVVGVHMIGADAPEIIQGFAVALKCGATKRDFDRTIGIHPTAAEELVTMREPISPVPVAPLDEAPAGRRVVDMYAPDASSPHAATSL